MKTVVVLAGGYSTEHHISLASGRTAEAAFIEAGYKVLFVVLKKDGFWLEDQLIKLTDLGADFVFNIIHGTPGEDGHISGMLEVFGIPHSTCPTFQSALTFNKARCNQILRTAGYDVPKGQLFAQLPDLDLFNTWNFPVFVKPNRAGSSFGVTRVEATEELEAAFNYAFSEDDEVLVEEGVIGTEVGCGVLRYNGEQPEAIAITEIVPTDAKFFDYKAKYEGKSQEITPARISTEVAEKISEISQKINQTINDLITVLVTLVLTTIILPLSFLYLFYRLFRFFILIAPRFETKAESKENPILEDKSSLKN